MKHYNTTKDNIQTTQMFHMKQLTARNNQHSHIVSHETILFHTSKTIRIIYINLTKNQYLYNKQHLRLHNYYTKTTKI